MNCLLLLVTLCLCWVGFSVCQTPTYTQSETPASTALISSQTFDNGDTGTLTGQYMSVKIFVGTITNSEDVKILMPPAGSIMADTGYTLVGTPYSLRASDDEPYLFNIPPKVSIMLMSSDVDGKDPKKLALYFMPAGQKWMLVDRSMYDASTMTVYGYPDRDGYMAVFYGDVKSSDTQNKDKVKSKHVKGMPSKGAWALICMGVVAFVAIVAVAYKKMGFGRGGGGGGASAAASKKANRTPNPVEKEHAMEAGVAATSVTAAVAAKEKPAHSNNARKSMKVDKLPKGWMQYDTDDGSGVYYYNEEKNLTQWERPTK